MCIVAVRSIRMCIVAVRSIRMCIVAVRSIRMCIVVVRSYLQHIASQAIETLIANADYFFPGGQSTLLPSSYDLC